MARFECAKHIDAEFFKSGKCKTCNREYQKEWFSKNRKLQQQRVSENTKRYKDRNGKFVWDYKRTHPCVDCGESDPVVLDFDHVGDKSAGIAILWQNCVSIQSLEKEMSQCEIRCANCHRRKTHIQLNRKTY